MSAFPWISVLGLLPVWMLLNYKEKTMSVPIMNNVTFKRTGNEIVAKTKVLVAKHEAELAEIEGKLAAAPEEKEVEGFFPKPSERRALHDRAKGLKFDIVLMSLIARAIEDDAARSSVAPGFVDYALTLDDLNALGF